MSYENVLEIIENNKNRLEVSNDIETLINNYIEIIKRDILKDEELNKICRDIYLKHKKALDLIYENMPDKTSGLYDIITKWLIEKTNNNELIFDKDFTTKSYIRFRTKEMDNTIPLSDEANSGWKSKNHYFYEIINNRGSEFYMQFVLNGENLTDEQKNIAEEINKISPSKQQKIVWQWRTHFSTKRIKTDDELDEQKIISQLEKLLQEIKAFEASLLDKLKKC
jgi:hypothetical protein